MRDLHLVVIDTETGGLDPDKHCIIEIAAAHVVLSDREISWSSLQSRDGFHAYAFPDRPVGERAAEINGYTKEAWAISALSMLDVAAAFVDWLHALDGDGLIWAGSNVSGFDLPFLRSDFARVGRKLPGAPKFTHRTLNTESLCFPLFARGETDGCGLRHLRKWAGLDGEQQHTARQDVADTISVLRAYFVREVWS